jgi:predicted ATP-binding protein involved in virulence
MFLKKLELKNFKGFDDIVISFEDDKGGIRKQTLLLGQNGTGKSNVLKAIAMVTSGSEAILDLLTQPDDWVKQGQSEATITAALVTQKKEERNISLIIRRGASRNEVLKINDVSLTELDKALEHTSRNYFVAGYGASRRHNPGGEFKSSKERFRITDRAANVYTLFNTDAQLNSLTSWAMSFDYRSGGAKLNVVKNTLNYFLEGFKFYEIDKNNKTIIFSEGKNKLKLEALSDGYQNMAAWIGDLLYRLTETFNDYKSPLAARGLLLIDEIDLHLHPRWQRKLLDFINTKLPKMQVVATTHSPLTAQQTGEGELYALKKENGKVKLVPFIGEPKNLLIHQMLMSPVFGLETDESFEVQQEKKKYNLLKEKPKARRTKKEDTEMRAIQEKLVQLPERPVSIKNAIKHNELLRKIESKLQ